MNFAKNLKKIRIDNKMTQSDLAKKCGLTPSCISQLESDTRKPSYDAIRQIAMSLGVTSDYLLDINTKKSFASKFTEKISEAKYRNECK
jgi:transcriptional regulator with XRE-family HTH domain